MIKFAKAIGANTDFLTAQAFVFPKTISYEESSNDFYLGVIICGGGEDVFSKVRQAAPLIEEKFLNQALSASERIADLKSFIKDELKEVENLHLLISLWREGTLYLESLGNPQAYLKREGKIMTLLESQNQLVSGYLKEGDKLLLISPKIMVDSEPENWDQDFINGLIASSLDNLEEELIYTEAEVEKDKLEPVAAILIEREVSKKELEQDIPQLENQPDEQASPKITLNFASILGKIRNIIPKKSKKAALIFVFCLVSLLIAFSAFFTYLKQQSAKASRASSFVTQAKDKYTKAQSLKDSDFQSAQNNLNEAKSSLEQALKIDPKNPEALNFKNELEQNSNSLLHIYNISDWPIFLSLDLIKKDFKTSRLSRSLNNILLLDDNQKSLVAVDLKKKTNSVLAGPTQLGSAKFSAINGGFAYTYSDDKGILAIDLDNKKVTSVAKPDPDWGKIVDLYAFGSNVYALDSVKSQIWKYSPTKSGYSDKVPYVKDGQKLDFAGSKKLQIDYSVWVLKQGPQILKFTAGNLDNFSVGGLDKSLKELTAFFVAEGQTIDDPNAYSYFLDPENSRLVVLKKNGSYNSQYIGDKFKTATDLVVDESDKKIYLLEGGKIYQIPL